MRPARSIRTAEMPSPLKGPRRAAEREGAEFKKAYPEPIFLITNFSLLLNLCYNSLKLFCKLQKVRTYIYTFEVLYIHEILSRTQGGAGRSSFSPWLVCVCSLAANLDLCRIPALITRVGRQKFLAPFNPRHSTPPTVIIRNKSAQKHLFSCILYNCAVWGGINYFRSSRAESSFHPNLLRTRCSFNPFGSPLTLYTSSLTAQLKQTTLLSSLSECVYLIVCCCCAGCTYSLS